jgi:hypothetical protein
VTGPLAVIPPRRGCLGLADDAQRMIVWCALHDACEWHDRYTKSCDACKIAGTCAQHWREHYEPCDFYREIMMRFDEYEGLKSGIACTLTDAERQAIVAALSLAIAYRNDQPAAENDALAAAYRQLAQALNAECR